jgi:carboxymethylenebutenolidase
MKHRLFPTLALAITLVAFAVSANAAEAWAKDRVEKSPRHLEWVTLKHDSREVGAYVGYPEVKDKATAVLVIHEIYGHSDWVKGLVDELAEAGYIAIAPDLLWGAGAKGGGTSELTSPEISQKIQRLPADQKTADLSAALDYVAHLPACNGKVVVAGFCWGGGESFRFAANNQAVKAALVFYGTPPPAADMARIAVPVYGFYAENDARVSSTIPTATATMKAAGKIYEPVIYAGAGHGFMRAGEAPDASAANKQARDDGWKRWMGILKDVTDAPTERTVSKPAVALPEKSAAPLSEKALAPAPAPTK